MSEFKPVMLIIRDGWGYTEREEGNAIFHAKKPFSDECVRLGYPSCLLKASGEAVGLPEGQMGNSEVGHTNLGAGRVVYQDFTRINVAIRDGSFQKNPVLVELLEKTLKNNGALHLLGLVSDGGVHSHIEHLKAIVKAAAEKGLKKVFLHAFMDGRDTSPTDGIKYLDELEEYFAKIGTGRIATISGRYYAMDRDKRWDRIEKAYDALTAGTGEKISLPVNEKTMKENGVWSVERDEIHKVMENCYKKGETDEFIIPKVVFERKEDGTEVPVATIRDGDSVLFFNFRADRAREMTLALNFDDFEFFKRKVKPAGLNYVIMTRYDEKYNFPVLFPPVPLTRILGEIFAEKGLKQLRIAETEKYAHVTFFFNGGEEKIFPGEERILIPSPKVATYDLQPEMSAPEVRDALIAQIDRGVFDLIVCNFANPDMVGHTGKFEAAVRAIETVDQCVGAVVKRFREKTDGHVLILADHGNAEQMWDYETKGAFTEHTVNPVPMILITSSKGPKGGAYSLIDGALCDVAPTVLELAGFEKPAEMTGRSLLVEKI